MMAEAWFRFYEATLGADAFLDTRTSKSSALEVAVAQGKGLIMWRQDLILDFFLQ
jgi:hypothetical protein